jgi:hypothetical protein
LEPEIIQPCSCGNRTSTLGNKYNHVYNYTVNSNLDPVPVTLSLELTANTKYFAWSFNGKVIPDRITIYLSGSSYPTLIGLDDILVGEQLPANSFNITDFPKSADTAESINKIVNLEKFTINSNDKIIFKVYPATSETSWDLSYTCLSDAKCSSCLNNSLYYKIKKDSINLEYNENQCVTYINFEIENPCNTSSDFFTYMGKTPYFTPFNINTSPNPSNTLGGVSLGLERQSCQYTNYINNNDDKCTNTTTPFTYIKSVESGLSVYTFTGDSSVINSYYVELLNAIQTYSGLTTTDNTKLDYYNYLRLRILNGGTSCPDDISYSPILIPINSVITKSLDGKTLTIKPQILTYNPLVLNEIPDIDCTSCGPNFFLGVANLINYYTSGLFDTTKITISNGYPTNLVINFWKTTVVNYTSLTASTFVGYYNVNDYFLNTIPFSGTNNTLIPSLSSTTCSNLICGQKFGFNIYNYKFYYTFKYVDISDPQSFKIYASPINNCIPNTNVLNEIYFYSGGTVLYQDPNYII